MDTTPNLALGRPTFASSMYPKCSPTRAVDGVTQYGSLDSDYPQVFHSAEKDIAPWFSVDLGTTSASVSRVAIWSRCDADQPWVNAELRIGNTSIQSYADTSALTSNPLVWILDTAIGKCSVQVVSFNTFKVGRWVTLQMKQPAYLVITEMQVFGYTGARSNADTSPSYTN